LHKVALLRCFSFNTQMSFIFNYNKWAIIHLTCIKQNAISKARNTICTSIPLNI
jgi:hypothetical protein